MDGRTLTDLFRRLGAPEPEKWARSQLEEGIPQLGRFLFLRQAWRGVVVEGDSSWIRDEIEASGSDPNGPFAGIGHGLQALRRRGATDEEITDVVRGMQVMLLRSLCYLLSDPGDLEDEVAEVGWALMQLDEDDQPLLELGGLHESVLGLDPTGREMRPR